MRIDLLAVPIGYHTGQPDGPEGSMHSPTDAMPMRLWQLPLMRAFAAWVAGIVAGWLLPVWLLWSLVTAGLLVSAIAGAVRRLAPGIVTLLACAAIGTVSAAWSSVYFSYELDSVNEAAERQLVDLEGAVRGQPYIALEPRGEMGRFAYDPPSTSFQLEVEIAHLESGPRRVHGLVLVSVDAVDLRLRSGDRVRCQGWLIPIDPPQNPGQRDARQYVRSHGISGRLLLKSLGNCQWIGPGNDFVGALAGWRDGLADSAQRALVRGLPDEIDPATTALLQAILLGERSNALGEIEDAFRYTGLAHLLSISGLHVGILAGGAWLIVQLLSHRPRWSALAALVVVGLYIAVVPVRPPIIRAGIMALACGAAMLIGRRITATSFLAAAGIGLLAWRPGDLFEPGFQLSFGIVLAMIIGVPPVAGRLDPGAVFDQSGAAGRWWRRWLVQYLAACFVAWAVALPIVAYHFHIISPLAIAMSIAALPLIMVLLWMGFAKIALTLALPWTASVTGPWLAHGGQLFADFVAGAAGLPGVWMAVPAVSAWWALAVLGLVGALLGGWFAQRRLALMISTVACGVWLFWPSLSPVLPMPGRDALRLDMMAVGDGSCYLLRSGGQTMMVDCGSAGYSDIGESVVLPALRQLGVMRIDRLVITHADIDHFNGALTIANLCGLEELLTSRYVIDEAEAQPWAATGYLIEQLRKTGVTIRTIGPGWSTTLGSADIRCTWPVAEALPVEPHGNDTSIVLRIGAAGRTVMLCGDIQEQAMLLMQRREVPLGADVVDLPHHGSFVEPAPAWLRRVDPQIVLQSCGWRRMRDDPWPDHLGERQRYVSARDGMVSLRITRDGRIHPSCFMRTED